MPRGKIEGGGVSQPPSSNPDQATEEPEIGTDRLLRTVTRTAGYKVLAGLVSFSKNWINKRPVKWVEPVITPYHQDIEPGKNGIIPSLNTGPFNRFWKDREGAKNFTDTVDHQVKEVREVRGEALSIDGVWHLKSPGKESPRERRKRGLQRFIYKVLKKPYKGCYYDDPKLLVQKEVLATNLYRAVMLEGENPDKEFSREYQCGYSFDEEKDRHCIAIKHLDGFEDASKLFHKQVEGGSDKAFEEPHNPASALVIRRFFLGDEDYLKLDNYMNKTNKEHNKITMYCIDFGMAFYNLFRLPHKCNYEQFKKKLLAKSGKHRVQYRGKPTIMTVLKQMGADQVEHGIKTALTKISQLDDTFLEKQLWHIHDENARKSLLAILINRRDQVRAILYPENNFWPGALTKEVSDGLVRPDRRS